MYYTNLIDTKLDLGDSRAIPVDTAHLVIREGLSRCLKGVRLSFIVMHLLEILDVANHFISGKPRTALIRHMRTQQFEWLHDFDFVSKHNCENGFVLLDFGELPHT